MQELCQEGHGDCDREGGGAMNRISFDGEWYYKRVKSTRRPSKHERLLKALLSVVCVYEDGMATCNCKRMDVKTAKQLIAIKEAMEKKARKV